MWSEASAPGSLMLLGEYAVLEGFPALVCAIDRRLYVRVRPRVDEKIKIHSDRLGCFETSIRIPQVMSPWQFVLTVLQTYQSSLKTGYDIEIRSDFSERIGFGSSAAVVVALIQALNASTEQVETLITIMQKAREVIRQVQGMGSGADVAASVFGGLIAYQADSVAEPMIFPQSYPLTAVYVGYKTPTPQVFKFLEEKYQHDPERFNRLKVSIGEIAREGLKYAEMGEWSKLGATMQEQQKQMALLGVNNLDLQEIIGALTACKSILGAKISGSGLGDCVIGLGELSAPLTKEMRARGMEAYAIKMSAIGVRCEKN